MFTTFTFKINHLQDLRNYQYSLSVVEGLRIHMEMGHSYIDIPRSSFTEVRQERKKHQERGFNLNQQKSS